MTPQEHEELLRKVQPNLGMDDSSKCMPGWIRKFCSKWDNNEGIELSHQDVGNLCHTLIAAKIRTERLVKERDRYKSILIYVITIVGGLTTLFLLLA